MQIIFSFVQTSKSTDLFAFCQISSDHGADKGTGGHEASSGGERVVDGEGQTISNSVSADCWGVNGVAIEALESSLDNNFRWLSQCFLLITNVEEPINTVLIEVLVNLMTHLHPDVTNSGVVTIGVSFRDRALRTTNQVVVIGGKIDWCLSTNANLAISSWVDQVQVVTPSIGDILVICSLRRVVLAHEKLVCIFRKDDGVALPVFPAELGPQLSKLLTIGEGGLQASFDDVESCGV